MGSADGQPTGGDPARVPDAVRLQILATEHWSLLATRSMTWNEMFSRAGMYLTVLSAATVALALMAQAAGFGGTFRLFALLLLPVVLLLGLGTQIRLGDARAEDVWLVVGMNRLRHAYLDLAPDLDPYFVTSRYDDQRGIMQTYGAYARVTPARVLAGTPILVGLINAVVAGVLAAFVADALGAPAALRTVLGVVGALAYAAALATTAARQIARVQHEWLPRFPGPPQGTAGEQQRERSAS